MTDGQASGAAEKKGGLRSDQFSGLMLLALALYVGWENRVYPIGSLQEPGPGYLPLLLVIFLGALGVLIAIFGSRSPRLASMQWGEAGRAVVILVACAVAAFALERIGYRLTVIALLIFFIGVLERRPPVATALVSLGFGFGSHYVVGHMLHVPLPVSPWGF